MAKSSAYEQMLERKVASLVPAITDASKPCPYAPGTFGRLAWLRKRYDAGAVDGLFLDEDATTLTARQPSENLPSYDRLGYGTKRDQPQSGIHTCHETINAGNSYLRDNV